MRRRHAITGRILVLTFTFTACFFELLVRSGSLSSCNHSTGTSSSNTKIKNNLAVSKGQSFFYDYPEARRHSSFEVWRPKAFFEDESVADDNIAVIVRTSTATVWQKLPPLLITLLKSFPRYAVYSDSADMVGDAEVFDAIADLPSSVLQKSLQLETYRLQRSVRDQHVPLNLDRLTINSALSLDRFQVLPALYHAYNALPESEWYIVMRDDSFVFEQNIRTYLNELNSSEPLYLGSAVAGLPYLFADGGSVIVLSQGLMAQAFGDRDSSLWVEDFTERVMRETLGDYVLAAFLYEKFSIALDVEKSAGRFQGNQLWSLPISLDKWCTPIISTFSDHPRQKQLLWEYQNLKANAGVAILYSDIYLDFIKPYIPHDPQVNWDNYAKDVEFRRPNSLAKESAESPWASLDACRRACDAYENCFMFRFDPYLAYCGLGINSITLGQPVLAYDDDVDLELCAEQGQRCINRSHTEALVSVWCVDRIREARRGLSCDELHNDPQNEGVPYGTLDLGEGWWQRMRMRHVADGMKDPLYSPL